MVKNLFITIHVPDDDPQERRGRSTPTTRGHDPGRDFVQPPPDDPGRDFVQPPPDDPGRDFVQPPPDDPGRDFVEPPPDDPGRDFVQPPPDDPRVFASVQARPFVGVPASCCRGGDTASEGASSAAPSRDYSGFVIVRLAADVRPLHFENLYHLSWELGLEGLRAVLEVEPVAGEPPGGPPGTRSHPGSRGEIRESRRRPKKPKNWVGPTPGPAAGASDSPFAPKFPEPAGVLRSAPLIDIPALRATCNGNQELRKATLYVIDELEGWARTTDFRPLHSLASYWRVDLRPYPELVEEVVEAFQRLREVDVAYRELAAFDSQAEVGGEGLAADQGYLDESPTGIGARWAWNALEELSKSAKAPKRPIRIFDLEQGWILDHEALGQRVPEPVYGDNRAAPETPELGQHGTAVLGQLAASQVLNGAIRDAKFFVTSHYKGPNDEGDHYPFPRTNGHVAAAIVNALRATRTNPEPLFEEDPEGRGNVLLLEVQRGRFPTEIDPADFDAIRLASALGVIVVEAAGNGTHDLDRVRDPVDGRGFRRGASNFVDSGAIFVGAAQAELPHDRASFSNFGSRVDCFAWGESVTTAGYGDLMGDDVPAYYTNTFNGTSSAAPVLAGAAALVQSLHAAQAETPLRPRPLRALLSNPETGVRQGPNVGGHIGIMPDLRRVLGGELQVVPRLYLRKRPGDDGTPSGPDDEISSSPDVMVWEDPLPTKGDSQASFGSASPAAHDPVPGQALAPGTDRKVYVRLCNRGGGEATGHVHVFAGPAATLVSPERWSKLGEVQVPKIVQGDTLTVSEGVPWTGTPSGPELPQELTDAGWGSPVRLHSLLAVLPREDVDESWPVLPPGPPWFAWDTFRDFLRRRGVAWRNAHRVEIAKGPADLTLACHVAGTPDHERRFDFEVIQRLPSGAKVTLAAPTGLAAKLHQRQPWLKKEGNRLTLPQRRGTRFSRVSLAAHAFPPVWLRVEDPNGSLGWGHSLALRQLWEGREVGRVTWHFGRS